MTNVDRASTSFVDINDLLMRLWHHLSIRRRRQFVLVLGLMLISSFLEVISLSAVLPFLGVLVAPESIFNRPIGVELAQVFGVTSAQQLVLLLSIAFAIAALLAGCSRVLLLWVTTKVVFASGSDLSIEVFRRTLYQPYQVHVDRNSSELLSSLTNKVNSVVFGVMQPLLTIATSIVLLISITIAFVAIEPFVAFFATAGFGTCYILISWLARQRLNRNSGHIAQEETKVIKILQEGIGGIRDVLLNGAQPIYCAAYLKADQSLRRAQGNNVFIAGSPRYAIEVLGIVFFTALAYALSSRTGGVAAVLPVLGALALGAQRLLPAMQNAYSSWASIMGSRTSLSDIVDLLELPLPDEVSQQIPKLMTFCDNICFNNVSFRYMGDSPLVLDRVNFVIQAGARIGFVGRTGSGKSTALDLLMGLLQPTEGEILVDGQSISGDRLRDWQQAIAHVPQSIYLADNTLAENIAFGVPPDVIDMNRVQNAARQAQIAEYIESKPKGYRELVGERGIRLSGGQRQRIGIARALYKQSSILVFDEATSALDNTTEQSVMDAIKGLDRKVTVLIIAHRLTTVQHCDTIVEMNNGRVMIHESYQKMLQCSNGLKINLSDSSAKCNAIE
jgi:ATP-binding cassette, subfamily B, bacterial PglK